MYVFQPREFPRSGSNSKAIDVEEERAKVGNNNGQQRIANATSGGARKPPGTINLNIKKMIFGDTQ